MFNQVNIGTMITNKVKPNSIAGLVGGETISFDYINYRGEDSARNARVTNVYIGSTEYHTGEQWLVDAIDLDKDEWRVFAAKDMRNMEVK